MIVCLYRIDPRNVGDRVCCPADYFHLGNTVRLDLAKYFEQDTQDALRTARRIVLGGGGVFHFEEAMEHLFSTYGPKTIAWGVGANRHGSKKPVYPRNLDKCRLVGLRDACDTWVPCVSCESPLFDKQYPQTCPVVVFEHKDFRLPDGLPSWNRIKNNVSFERAISHLGTAQTVVTNSYHGAYWATLLSKRTILFRPFSSKFYCMKWQPPIATDIGRLLQLVNEPLPATQGDRLAFARERNRLFYAQVKRLVDLAED